MTKNRSFFYSIFLYRWALFANGTINSGKFPSRAHLKYLRDRAPFVGVTGFLFMWDKSVRERERERESREWTQRHKKEECDERFSAGKHSKFYIGTSLSLSLCVVFSWKCGTQLTENHRLLLLRRNTDTANGLKRTHWSKEWEDKAECAREKRNERAQKTQQKRRGRERERERNKLFCKRNKNVSLNGPLAPMEIFLLDAKGKIKNSKKKILR